ncbi:MAG: GAF domain-containing sensor histidine kinase [Aggregatilineales bacterium]
MDSNPTPQLQALKDTQPLQPTSDVQSKLITQKLRPLDAPLSRMSESKSQEEQLRATIRKISQHAKQMLDFDHCSVYLQTQETFRYFIMFDATAESVISPPRNFDQLRQIITRGTPHITTTSRPTDFYKTFNSQILMPILVDGKAVGLFNFACKAASHYTKQDVRIVYALTNQLAANIHSANLQEQIKHMKAKQDMLEREIDGLNRDHEDTSDKNTELEAYAHTVAHDLKTPLGAAMVQLEMVDLLMKKNTMDRVEHFVTGAKSELWRMKDMIEQLLVLATVDELDETLYKVKANAVIDRAVERFQYEIHNRNITLNVMPEMPALWGNNQWVEEVFANLISNAIKYMGDNPTPNISVSAKIQDYQVRYEVTDNGIGIKKEDQEKLFKKFARLHTINTTGTGLGLNIVQRIVHKLGGETGFESTFGEGSTFWFTVPHLYELPKAQ